MRFLKGVINWNQFRIHKHAQFIKDISLHICTALFFAINQIARIIDYRSNPITLLNNNNWSCCLDDLNCFFNSKTCQYNTLKSYNPIKHSNSGNSIIFTYDIVQSNLINHRNDFAGEDKDAKHTKLQGLSFSVFIWSLK